MLTLKSEVNWQLAKEKSLNKADKYLPFIHLGLDLITMVLSWTEFASLRMVTSTMLKRSSRWMSSSLMHWEVCSLLSLRKLKLTLTSVPMILASRSFSRVLPSRRHMVTCGRLWRKAKLTKSPSASSSLEYQKISWWKSRFQAMPESLSLRTSKEMQRLFKLP